jgi:hypothetical protein
MTNEELKKKIAEAPDQEWFKTVPVTFNFPIPPQLTFTGVSAIYEYVNQQVDGWNKYENLPKELEQSKAYFVSIKDAISKFVNGYFQQSGQQLRNYWQQHVANVINNLNQRPLPYSTPEVIYLLKVHQDTPEFFQGAYNFLLKTNNYNLNNPGFLYGAILAYEFTLKEHTDITERRNAEKKSISKLKADFLKYLPESEEQLSTYLNNAYIKYAEYVKNIDALKADKEKLFSDWFENTKDEQWQKWFDPAVKKVAELEETYKEKLKLEEPAKYWSDRAGKLKCQGWLSLGILVGLVVVICLFLASILWNPPEIFKESIFSEDKSIAIKWILIYVTLLSFLAYAIRALSKVMFSSFHLARDCEERHTLTYFYLSLLKDSKVDEKDRQLIIQSLFSRADTGLLKDDSSPTMPNDIINRVMPK